MKMRHGLNRGQRVLLNESHGLPGTWSKGNRLHQSASQVLPQRLNQTAPFADGEHLPHLVAGILYSGEPQLAECVRSLLSQSGVIPGYFVIAGRTKAEAHQELYRRFSELAPRADVLLKLDADMVIRAPDLGIRAAQYLRSNPEVSGISLPVFDHLTHAAMTGISIYNPSVFEVRGSLLGDEGAKLFTDRVDLAGAGLAFTRLGYVRAPVDHCPDPSPFQAFHYGVHRGVKVRFATNIRNLDLVQGHILAALRLRVQARRTRDWNRAFAYLGFALGAGGDFEAAEVNYTNPTLLKCFENLDVPDDPEMLLAVADKKMAVLLRRRPRLLAAFIRLEARRRARLLAHSKRRDNGMTTAKLGRRRPEPA